MARQKAGQAERRNSVPRRSSPCKDLVQASDKADSREAGRGVIRDKERLVKANLEGLIKGWSRGSFQGARNFVSSTALSLACSTVHTVGIPETVWRSFHACVCTDLVSLMSVWYSELHIFPCDKLPLDGP